MLFDPRIVDILLMLMLLYLASNITYIHEDMFHVSNCYSSLENAIIKRRDMFLRYFIDVVVAYCCQFSCCYFLDNNITYFKACQATMIIIRRFSMLLSSDETCSILRYKGSVIQFLS